MPLARYNVNVEIQALFLHTWDKISRDVYAALPAYLDSSPVVMPISGRRPQIEKLINGSLSCRQELFYACKRARLLNSPVREGEPFEPFSWWVSRNNEQMDYWGGSQPGSRKCACGIQGTCLDRNKYCNCDAGECF